MPGCANHETLPAAKSVQVEYVVTGVTPLKQKSSMACWITCAAMLKSWKEGDLVSPEQLAKTLGEFWLNLFQTDTGLPREKYLEFAKDAGLRFQWPANWLPEGYINLLKDHGPLWIASGVSSHARVLYGVVKRGEKFIMLFMDPASGTAREEAFQDFFPEFEKEAVLIVGYRPDLALPVQILHY